MPRLQRIQNAAAGLLTRTTRREHITPVLAVLHWLPVSFRIAFKILLLVFKAMSGLPPAYICDMLTPYGPGRCLRSSGGALVVIPKSRQVTKGDRTFAIWAPKLWNSLPGYLMAGKLFPLLLPLSMSTDCLQQRVAAQREGTVPNITGTFFNQLII